MLFFVSRRMRGSGEAGGRTPLHYSAQNGWTRATQSLLKSGADVNFRDRNEVRFGTLFMTILIFQKACIYAIEMRPSVILDPLIHVYIFFFKSHIDTKCICNYYPTKSCYESADGYNHEFTIQMSWLEVNSI